MEIKVGDIISIQHYSGLTPFRSVVVNVSEDQVTVRLTKEFAIMSFLEGDPVIFGYEKGDNVYIFGCDVVDIRPREDTIRLHIDTIQTEENRRQCERFPVSLYADIKLSDARKKHLAAIKDISYYGMRIYTKANFEINDIIEMDIFMDKSIISVKSNIVRKQPKKNNNEYGLTIMYEDNRTMGFIKDYINRLQQDQEDSMRRLKNNR